MSGLIIAGLTCVFIIVSILFFPEIRIRHFHLPTYLAVAVTGAILLLITKNTTFSGLAEAFSMSAKMNPWKILVLFISMTVLSIFLDEIGFFRYLANIAIQHLKKSQLKLFFGFYAFLSILTIFTSNDIIILTFTPFICYFTHRAKINPIPYLVSEFVASNTWSMVLIVGNPTNIYLASSFDIGFLEYARMMILPTLGASLISLGLLYFLFHKDLKTPMEVQQEYFDKPDTALTLIGLVHLAGCIVLVAISNYINLEMWIITLGFCISLTLCYLVHKLITKNKKKYLMRTYARAPWSLIPFVLSMFILVLALKEQGFTEKLSEFFGNDNVFVYGYSGALAANLINNIPMSVLYAEILNGASLKAVYAAVIASNIAAFISPFGALAGIMWMNLLKNFRIPFTFGKFLKYGCIIGIPALSAALLLLFVL